MNHDDGNSSFGGKREDMDLGTPGEKRDIKSNMAKPLNRVSSASPFSPFVDLICPVA
jgi:hypothetical protein